MISAASTRFLHIKVQVRIRAADETAATLHAWTDLLVTMAGLESVAIAPDMQRSPDAATVVVGPVEVSIPGIIDVDKEKARLTKQREQLLSRSKGHGASSPTLIFCAKPAPR